MKESRRNFPFRQIAQQLPRVDKRQLRAGKLADRLRQQIAERRFSRMRQGQRPVRNRHRLFQGFFGPLAMNSKGAGHRFI